MPKPAYQRVLLKLSGEALQGKLEFGIDPHILDRIVVDVKELVDMQVQVGLVIGGGNLFRGKALQKAGLGRVAGDQMGMLATVMNAIALRDAFHRAELSAHIMSAIQLNGLAKSFDRLSAIELMQSGIVMIFAAGTGNPLVTTDSAASLRAIEIEADILLKATNVDGIYTADPKTDANAQLYHRVSFQEALEKELGVMDLSAFCQCRDHKMPIRVFNLNKTGVLKRIVMGEEEGTLVYTEGN